MISCFPVVVKSTVSFNILKERTAVGKLALTGVWRDEEQASMPHLSATDVLSRGGSGTSVPFIAPN